MARVWLFLCVCLIGCVPTNIPRSEAGSALYLLSNLSGLEGITRVSRSYGLHPRQVLDIYTPNQASSTTRGAIIFGYGGGYKDGNRDEYRFIGETFSSLGFVTIIYDYRLYPEVQFPTYLEDAASVMRWVFDHAAEYRLNLERLILAGHSAGAHIAAMLATNPTYLERVNLKPRAIALVVCLAGGYDFWNEQTGFISADIAAVMQGAPPAATQPIRFLTGAEPPMLLMHGQADTILPIAQARVFAQRAKRLGMDITMFEYSGDHASTVIDLAAPLRFRSSQYRDFIKFLQTKGLLQTK